MWIRDQPKFYKNSYIDKIQCLDKTKRLLLVTSHRRESFGEGIKQICKSLIQIVQMRPDVNIIFPVHLNPHIYKTVRSHLANHPQITLLEPVDYPTLIYLMEQCYFILTDSGGIQEEAPSLGKPVLIMRDTTERIEAIEAGCARLVGTSIESIVSSSLELLDDKYKYLQMASIRNPFGNGDTSRLISSILSERSS